jgi:hypothetical protein
MKSLVRSFWRLQDFAGRQAAPRHWPHPAVSRSTTEFPRANAMVMEIGLVLAVHLAVAFAVTATLMAFGVT